MSFVYVFDVLVFLFMFMFMFLFMFLFLVAAWCLWEDTTGLLVVLVAGRRGI